jgi:hypothetical protein
MTTQETGMTTDATIVDHIERLSPMNGRGG